VAAELPPVPLLMTKRLGLTVSAAGPAEGDAVTAFENIVGRDRVRHQQGFLR
jgi:hypothetical protein